MGGNSAFAHKQSSPCPQDRLHSCPWDGSCQSLQRSSQRSRRLGQTARRSSEDSFLGGAQSLRSAAEPIGAMKLRISPTQLIWGPLGCGRTSLEVWLVSEDKGGEAGQGVWSSGMLRAQGSKGQGVSTAPAAGSGPCAVSHQAPPGGHRVSSQGAATRAASARGWAGGRMGQGSQAPGGECWALPPGHGLAPDPE